MKNIKVRNDVKEFLRREREKVCFPIVNRGKVWYDMLSAEQIGELKIWYDKWLNVTETLQIPATPSWLNDKMEYSEDIL